MPRPVRKKPEYILEYPLPMRYFRFADQTGSMNSPGESHRKGIDIIQLLKLFPNETAARNWFEGILSAVRSDLPALRRWRVRVEAAIRGTTSMSRHKSGKSGGYGVKMMWAVAANGEPAHISEVSNGLKCGCTCPICNGPLVARQGKIMGHHYAHASGAECNGAAETMLHFMAKDILSRRKEIVLPQVVMPKVLEYAGSGKGSHCCDPRITLAPQRRYTIDSVKVERKTGAIVPDVIIEVKGRHLLVEVTVTHGVDTDKLTKIRELGLSCIEIDLSAERRELGRKDLEKIVVDGSAQKRWIHNVQANAKRNAMLAEATFLPTEYRGFALHADGCPKPARVWKGKAYANMVDDCIGCEHMLGIGADGIICEGFMALRKPPPPTEYPTPPCGLPPAAFDHPEHDDPMESLSCWLKEYWSEAPDERGLGDTEWGRSILTARHARRRNGAMETEI